MRERWVATLSWVVMACSGDLRAPEPAPHDLGPGRVEVRTFDTDRAETEHVADLLRRAHLEDGIA